MKIPTFIHSFRANQPKKYSFEWFIRVGRVLVALPALLASAELGFIIGGVFIHGVPWPQMRNTAFTMLALALVAYLAKYARMAFVVLDVQSRELHAANVVLRRRLDALAPSEPQAPPAPPAAIVWPWGSHHTEMLGHLQAAAQQWWTTYEPAIPATAPTNEMVADWLHTERGVSRDKARAIASILRPDGLRTGRRP